MKMATMSQVLTHRNQSHAHDSLLRLSKLRKEGILCDLTILVQGQKFKAHKAVMAACSDYFLTAICGGKSTASVSVSNGASGGHMTIELQYVTLRGFAPLLEYAYTSDLNVNASDVIDVLAAASYMQMFDVASACTEFMRSNLLWTQSQSRLAGLPLLPGGRPLILNGQHNGEHGSSSPNNRSNGLPEAVSNLLQASAMSANSVPGVPAPGLGRPPMLIPISSMSPYEVGLQQWAADTIAGKNSFLSRIVNRQVNSAMASPPSSISPASSTHNSPMNGWNNDRATPSSLPAPTSSDRRSPAEMAMSDKGSPTRDENGYHPTEAEEQVSPRGNSNSNNNNYCKTEKLTGSSNNRKSVAIKVETTNNDELISESPENGEGRETGSPPEDAEDSWQSLQRLYSFQNKAATSKSGSSEKLSPAASDDVINGFVRNTMSPALLSRIAATNSLKMALNLNQYKETAVPPLENAVSMVSNLNGLNVHRAILQHQQQLIAQQQQQQHEQQQQRNDEVAKTVPELPAVPPGGQYMSVRRRTLQSNVPKPHQCQICGSRFTRFHNLKQHIKLHSGIKPYECDECGKRFTRNYTLRLHKMKHVGLRNFRCGTCDAAFTSLGEFRAHLRITMHSHLPANGSDSSPQMHEPEDLSGGHVLPNPVKFGQFDYSLLNYGVGSPGSSGGGAAGEGSTGTISPPALSNVSRRNLGHVGSESPHLSDRSLSGSPDDLSKKRSLSDTEGKVRDRDSDYSRHALASPLRDMQLGEEEGKRMRVNCESPLCKTENEKIAKDYDHDGDEPMSLVVDTGAAENSD